MVFRTTFPFVEKYVLVDSSLCVSASRSYEPISSLRRDEMNVPGKQCYESNDRDYLETHGYVER